MSRAKLFGLSPINFKRLPQFLAPKEQVERIQFSLKFEIWINLLSSCYQPVIVAMLPHFFTLLVHASSYVISGWRQQRDKDFKNRLEVSEGFWLFCGVGHNVGLILSKFGINIIYQFQISCYCYIIRPEYDSINFRVLLNFKKIQGTCSNA